MNKDDKNIFSISVLGLGFSISNEDLNLNSMWALMWVGVLIFVMSGCSHIPFIDEKVEDPAPVIKEAIDTSKEASKNIQEGTDKTIEKAKEIKEESGKIIDKVPEDTKPKIQPNVDKIDKNADDIIALQKAMKEMSNKLETSAARLESAQTDINKLTQQKEELLVANQDLTERLNEALADAAKQRNAYLTWLIIGGIIMLAICGVAVARGETKAMWGAVAAIIVIVVSLVVSYFAVELAIWGLVALVVTIVIAVFVGYKTRVDKKAKKELVHSMEATKNKMAQDTKLAIFGQGAMPAMLDQIQSESTRKEVMSIRKANADFWGEGTIKNKTA